MSSFKTIAIAVVYGGMSLASATNLNLFSSLTTQGVLGNANTLTFSDDYGTGSITATGYTQNNGSTTALYYKTAGGDETGLGMNNDPSGDHEINGTQFIQLDFTALLTQYQNNSPYKLVSASTTIGSVQGGESYAIFGSNAAGTEGTQIGSTGTSDGTVTLTLAQLNQYHFISIASPAGNVLIDALSASTSNSIVTGTPEPGTWALMGSGLIGGFFLIRRRRRGAQL